MDSVVNEKRHPVLMPVLTPAILISYGFMGNYVKPLKAFNSEIREEAMEHVDENAGIDNFSQYVPALSVYALNAMGVEGQHDFQKRTLILGTSWLIMGATVTGLKDATRVERPDRSSRNSFPSGHTATAFMGAEFVRQEYKDQSPGYAIGAYVIAAGTGAYRMYNNRHWLTDVATGAGIGILSTKLAYRIWNVRENGEQHHGVHRSSVRTMLYPSYQPDWKGVGFAMLF